MKKIERLKRLRLITVILIVALAVVLVVELVVLLLRVQAQKTATSNKVVVTKALPIYVTNLSQERAEVLPDENNRYHLQPNTEYAIWVDFNSMLIDDKCFCGDITAVYPSIVEDGENGYILLKFDYSYEDLPCRHAIMYIEADEGDLCLQHSADKEHYIYSYSAQPGLYSPNGESDRGWFVFSIFTSGDVEEAALHPEEHMLSLPGFYGSYVIRSDPSLNPRID